MGGLKAHVLRISLSIAACWNEFKAAWKLFFDDVPVNSFRFTYLLTAWKHKQSITVQAGCGTDDGCIMAATLAAFGDKQRGSLSLSL